MHCPRCGAVESCNHAQMIARLQSAGKLRRADSPDVLLIAEVARSAGAGWSCSDCGELGLQIQLADDAGETDWAIERLCASCGARISSQRLEVFPGAALCAACQTKADDGHADQPREFCPHCGGLMQLRQSRGGGIARYVNKCSDCGRAS